MKEFKFTKTHRGITLHCIAVTKNIKEVCRLFDVNYYFIKEYAYKNEPKTELAIKNPNKRIVYFEHSGEAGYFLPKEQINVPMLYEEAIKIIDEHRKRYPTHQDTINNFDRK